MSRPLRIEYPDACYHVMNRGNQRLDVFKKEVCYQHFLSLLGMYSKDFAVSVYAYCLMSNHFHLYVRTRAANLSRFMQALLGEFTISTNRRYGRSGHLFQGRFKSVLVETRRYSSRLSRYIHLNPIRAKHYRTASPQEKGEVLHTFPWSSYPQYLGLVEKVPWLDTARVLSSWGSRRDEQRHAYRTYVERGLIEEMDTLSANVIAQSILGSEEFVDRISREYLLSRPPVAREMPQLTVLQSSFEFEEIANIISEIYGTNLDHVLTRRSSSSEARHMLMYCACKYCRGGESLTNLARRFSVGLTGLTFGRDHVRDNMDSQHHLNEIIAKVESKLRRPLD